MGRSSHPANVRVRAEQVALIGIALSRVLTRRVRAFAAACALVALAACTLGMPAAVSDIRYDLGPQPAPAHATPTLRLFDVRLFDVRAPAALDTDDILYRMNSADPHRTSAYAYSHWTMRPAQLLTQRVRGVLAAHGAVLSGGETASAPLLTIDLEQFEQVFDSERQSHGVLTARATLMRDGTLIAQHTFVARAPAPTPNAAGGVQALAAASDQFAAQLVTWLGMQESAAAQ